MPDTIQIDHDDTVVWIGSIVSVVDNADDTHYHIGQVIDMTDQLTKIHYMGTRSRKLRSSAWKLLLYHHPGSGEVVSEQPENLIRNWGRFTGEVETLPRDESLILLSNIGFTPARRVNKVSFDMLNRLPLEHHVMGRTWDP